MMNSGWNYYPSLLGHGEDEDEEEEEKEKEEEKRGEWNERLRDGDLFTKSVPGRDSSLPFSHAEKKNEIVALELVWN